MVALAALALAGYLLAPTHAWRRLVEWGMTATTMTAIGVWIRTNRIALARLDEPAPGRERPQVRVIRSGNEPWRSNPLGQHRGAAPAGTIDDNRSPLTHDGAR